MFSLSLDRAQPATHLLNMFSSHGATVSQGGGGLVSEPVQTRASEASIHGRRAGRIAFGAVLILGMTSRVYETVVHGTRSEYGGPFNDDVLHPTHVARYLAVTRAIAIAGYALVRLFVRVTAPAPRGEGLLGACQVAPAVGIALALPLTVHSAFVLPFGSAAFDSWFQVSMIVLGAPQLVFAVTFGIHAAQLARGEPRMTIRQVFRWSVRASLVPSLIFFVMEPEGIIFAAIGALEMALATAITGLLVLPVLRRFDALARRDRDALPVLPLARVL
jgi:hypothetical protein